MRDAEKQLCHFEQFYERHMCMGAYEWNRQRFSSRCNLTDVWSKECVGFEEARDSTRLRLSACIWCESSHGMLTCTNSDLRREADIVRKIEEL